MAHFVVLEVDDNGPTRTVEGLAYLPVPPGANEAGVAWTEVARGYTIYSRRRTGGVTSALIPVPIAVQAQLDSGQIFEVRFTAQMASNLSPSQTLAAIKAHVNDRQTAIMAELGQRLRYWGFQAESTE